MCHHSRVPVPVSHPHDPHTQTIESSTRAVQVTYSHSPSQSPSGERCQSDVPHGLQGCKSNRLDPILELRWEMPPIVLLLQLHNRCQQFTHCCHYNTGSAPRHTERIHVHIYTCGPVSGYTVNQNVNHITTCMNPSIGSDPSREPPNGAMIGRNQQGTCPCSACIQVQ